MSASRMEHPILGTIEYDREEHGWVGSVALPTLAAYGAAVTDDYRGKGGEAFRPHLELFARGRFRLLTHGNRKVGPSAPQVEAVRRLLADEAGVCGLVLAELLDAFQVSDLDALRSRAWCRAMEVADKQMGGGYLGGVAYLGFVFSSGLLEECPLCVVYHPDLGTWWAEAPLDEALAED